MIPISIHAPVKGATSATGGIKTGVDFNPRSREGSDAQVGHRHQPVHISIHAPVKGATRTDRGIRLGIPISIHAPVKGATWAPALNALAAQFQSTLP